MAFCPYCGKEVSPQAVACPNCGHPLKRVEPNERISAWWWLVPFFLGWIGGLINYFVLKDRNRKTAEKMLIFGIIWTFVGAILFAAIVYAFITGLIGGLSLTAGGSGVGSSLVTFSGALSVPTGQGAGTLMITAMNTASNPITNIVLTNLTSNGSNYAPSAAFAFSTLPVQVGGTGSGSASYNPTTAGVCANTCPSGFESGSSYTALITITFSNGSQQTITLDMTAQL